MTDKKSIGVIMRGVKGRKGMNQHFVRSILAVRDQGGVTSSDGRHVVLDPILVGRSAQKIGQLASTHDIARRSCDIEGEGL